MFNNLTIDLDNMKHLNFSSMFSSECIGFKFLIAALTVYMRSKKLIKTNRRRVGRGRQGAPKVVQSNFFDEYLILVDFKVQLSNLTRF